MENVMDGPSWKATWPLFHPDDVVQLRTSAKIWNKGSKCGPYGELFFFAMHGVWYFREFRHYPI